MQMPEQQPPIDAQKLEFEQQKFQDESQRGWEDLAIRRTQVESVAVKNYADAESQEEGQQLQEYAGFMKMQQDDDLAGMKSNQAAEQFQQKQQQQAQQAQQQMQQKDQQHQQSMQQSEQMAQAKLAQGGNNGTGDNT
jgi:hypothetical protein